MVVLKKVKASTLIETITASVIIIIVFTIALLTLNNVFSNAINNDTSEVDNHINKLQYKYENKNIIIPYNEDFNNWELVIAKVEENSILWVEFKATNSKTKKTIKKRIIDVD